VRCGALEPLWRMSWNNGGKELREVLTRLRLSKIHARRGRLNAYDTGNVYHLSQGLQSYFASPLAYAIAGIFCYLGFLCDCAAGTRGHNSAGRSQRFVRAANGSTVSCGCSLRIPAGVLNLLGSLALFILPILSMGLYAEERKRGNSHVASNQWAVAVGKLLGC